MENDTMQALFGVETVVVTRPEIITPDDKSKRAVAVRSAVAHVIGAVPARVEITPLEVGRVVIVNVTPRAVPDPPIPVILGWMPTGYHWAMRCWWRALLRYIGGWPAVGQVHRRARVVLSTLGTLSNDEREFFTQALHAALLGDAR